MRSTIAAAALLSLAGTALADSVGQYGDADVLGTGVYSDVPTVGATVNGLAPGVTSFSTLITPHSFGFDPSGDFLGTDQIFVGSTQTAFHDGYSSWPTRQNGPQTITIDYSDLIGADETLTGLTLGIAADDFQFIPFGQLFTAAINGVEYPSLTNALNGLDQTGPVVQYFAIGLPTSLLTSDDTLILTIDQLGDGGDGWAIDFLTVGVTTVPAAGAAGLLGLAGIAAARRRR